LQRAVADAIWRGEGWGWREVRDGELVPPGAMTWKHPTSGRTYINVSNDIPPVRIEVPREERSEPETPVKAYAGEPEEGQTEETSAASAQEDTPIKATEAGFVEDAEVGTEELKLHVDHTESASTGATTANDGETGFVETGGTEVEEPTTEVPEVEKTEVPEEPEQPELTPEEVAQAEAAIGFDAQVRSNQRPVIEIVGGEIAELARQAETALIAGGAEIFQRGVLVRPALTEMPAAPRHGVARRVMVATLSTLTVAALRAEFCDYARWMKWSAKQNKLVKADPPEPVAAALRDAYGRWQFPQVRGVLCAPTMRPDGTILDRPGLDPATGYYLALLPGFRLPSIPPRPTKDEAIAALKRLDHLLEEFPWVDGVSRSVGLCCLITPVVRAALDVAPLHAITKPTPGTGSSYLINVAAAIATGDVCPVLFVGEVEGEFEKKLNGVLLDAPALFSIDNVSTPLGGDLLCQATEQTKLTLRRLGKSDSIVVLNGATIFASGNNLEFLGDITRRAILGALDRKVERPEAHRFARDPLAEVLKDRPRFVADVLTLVRAALEAPDLPPLESFVSYDAWTRFVRTPLVWLDYADPVESLTRVRDTDPHFGEGTAVTTMWEEVIGANTTITAPKIAQQANDGPPPPPVQPPQGMSQTQQNAWHQQRPQRQKQWLDDKDKWERFKLVLLEIAGERDTVSARRLGYWLRNNQGRVLGSRCIIRDGMSDGVARWKLVSV
jgi:putative DNA primase/helicase